MKSFVLNLPSATDRLQAFIEGFPPSLKMPDVWRAKPPEECQMPDWWRGTPEFWSNTKNVGDILAFASGQTENTLFFEDDCVFAPDFETQWNTFMDEVPQDYDLLNLCALHMCSVPYPPVQISPHVLCVKLGFNPNALVLTPKGAAKMLEQIQKPNWACKHICEQQLGYLHLDPEFKAYSPIQNFIGQRACYSSLCKRDRGERWYNKFVFRALDGKLYKSAGLYETE